MFFNIGPVPNKGFPVHVNYAGLSIDLDNGWTITDDKIYKGIDGVECSIHLANNTISINPGKRRTFPVFYNDTSISNIISYDNQWYEHNPLVIGNITLQPNSEQWVFKQLDLTDEQLFDCLYDYLDTKIKNFMPDVPIRFFPTGGVDTTVIFSFLVKHNKPYEILTAEIKEMDHFACYNRPNFGKFWCYQDIHHWKEHSILLSGANGDEAMLRNPQHAYMLAKLNGENILDTLADIPDSYHSAYYLKSKHKPSYQAIDNFNLNLEESRNYILNSVTFDFQHWHLGNTLTWTPLNDLELTNIMLNFSYPYIREQFIDATITKQLIARNNSDLLKYVSQSKNNVNFENLVNVFEGRETF